MEEDWVLCQELEGHARKWKEISNKIGVKKAGQKVAGAYRKEDGEVFFSQTRTQPLKEGLQCVEACWKFGMRTAKTDRKGAGVQNFRAYLEVRLKSFDTGKNAGFFTVVRCFLGVRSVCRKALDLLFFSLLVVSGLPGFPSPEGNSSFSGRSWGQTLRTGRPLVGWAILPTVREITGT